MLFYRRIVVLFPAWTKKLALQTTQPPVEWGAGTLCSGIKQPKRESNQSRPSSSKDKNVRTYTSTPPHAFMVCTQTTLVLRLTRITRNKGICPSDLHSKLRYLNPLLQSRGGRSLTAVTARQDDSGDDQKTCSNEYWLLATTTIDKHGNTSSCVRACLLSTTSVLPETADSSVT